MSDRKPAALLLAEYLTRECIDYHASWRCGYPEQFGECSCLKETVNDILDVIEQSREATS